MDQVKFNARKLYVVYLVTNPGDAAFKIGRTTQEDASNLNESPTIFDRRTDFLSGWNLHAKCEPG